MLPHRGLSSRVGNHQLPHMRKNITFSHELNTPEAESKNKYVKNSFA